MPYSILFYSILFYFIVVGTCSPGIRLENRGDYYYLEYGPMRVKWDEESSWYLTLEEPAKEQDSTEYQGMCGNFDRDPTSKSFQFGSSMFTFNIYLIFI
jgi:hypothetical protein